MVMEKENIIFGVIISVIATFRLEEVSPVIKVSYGRGIIDETIRVEGTVVDISLENDTTRIMFDRETKQWVVKVEDRGKCTCYLAELYGRDKYRFSSGYLEALIVNGRNTKTVYNTMRVDVLNYHSGKDAFVQHSNVSERARAMCKGINMYKMWNGYAEGDRMSGNCFRTCWFVCDKVFCYDECVYICP